MKLKSFLFLLFCFFYLVSSALAQASTPKAVVEDIFSKAGETRASTDAKLQEEINSYLDFQEMARISLGKWGSKIKKEDIQWFQSTLKEIITLSVYPEAPEFLKNVKIVYGKEKMTGKKAAISSVVKKKGDETQVDYHFALINNQWVVTDIALDEESWVESIASQVEDVMKKNGWAGLKAKLQSRLNEAKKNAKSKATL